MAAPQNGVLDDFSAALGANWTTPAGPAANTGIASTSGGVLVGQAPNTDALYTGGGSLYNSEVFFTVPTLPSVGNDFRALLRCKVSDLGATDQMMLRVIPDTSAWTIRVRQAGTLRTIATATQAFAAGDKVWFRAFESTYEAYIYTAGAWTLVASATDGSTPLAGYWGIALSDNTVTVRLDDFGGGEVTNPAPVAWLQG